MGLNRKHRKALARSHPVYYRMTPLFRAEDMTLVDGVETYVIHNDPESVIVAFLKENTASRELAKRLEAKLVETAKRDVVVLSDNVKLMRLEQVSYAEVAKMFPNGVAGGKAKANPSQD